MAATSALASGGSRSVRKPAFHHRPNRVEAGSADLFGHRLQHPGEGGKLRRCVDVDHAAGGMVRGVDADQPARDRVADHDRFDETGFGDRAMDHLDHRGERVRRLIRRAAVPGQVQDQHLAVEFQAFEPIQQRPPDRAVEAQAGQQNQRRAGVGGAVQVGREAGEPSFGRAPRRSALGADGGVNRWWHDCSSVGGFLTPEAFIDMERSVRSHPPTGGAARSRVVPAGQAGADRGLQVRADPGCDDGDAVQR